MTKTDDRRTPRHVSVTVQFMVLSAVLAGLIAIGALLRIELPFSPVPITLQTLFVLFAGLLLPPLWAAASVGLYLFAGIIGLPVFAGGQGGFAVIMGPSGGFLIGFLAAAIVTSLLSSLFRKRMKESSIPVFWGDIVALLVGTLIIYAFGYPWIVLNLGWEWRVGLARAVLPYLPGDLLKLITATLLAKPARIIILRNA